MYRPVTLLHPLLLPVVNVTVFCCQGLKNTESTKHKSIPNYRLMPQDTAWQCIQDHCHFLFSSMHGSTGCKSMYMSKHGLIRIYMRTSQCFASTQQLFLTLQGAEQIFFSFKQWLNIPTIMAPNLWLKSWSTVTSIHICMHCQHHLLPGIFELSINVWKLLCISQWIRKRQSSSWFWNGHHCQEMVEHFDAIFNP